MSKISLLLQPYAKENIPRNSKVPERNLTVCEKLSNLTALPGKESIKDVIVFILELLCFRKRVKNPVNSKLTKGWTTRNTFLKFLHKHEELCMWVAVSKGLSANMHTPTWTPVKLNLCWLIWRCFSPQKRERSFSRVLFKIQIATLVVGRGQGVVLERRSK